MFVRRRKGVEARSYAMPLVRGFVCRYGSLFTKIFETYKAGMSYRRWYGAWDMDEMFRRSR